MIQIKIKDKLNRSKTNKIAIKFTMIDDKNIEVIYMDGNKEILSLNKFNKNIEDGKVNMAFVVPK